MSNPREVALDTLLAVTEEGAYNSISLRQALRKNGAMSRADRAFVTQVVNGCLRNLLYLDFCLNAYSKTPVSKMKPLIRGALRTGAYQILFMERVPNSAACNETVALVKRRGLGALSGFVNGVLRALAQKGAPPLPEQDTAERLSLQYSHPLWLVRLWLAAYPADFVEALCAQNNTPPPVTVAVNPLRTTPEELARELAQSGVESRPGHLAAGALRLQHTADLTKLPAFWEGRFHVMDESAMAAVEALDPRPGERVLDACAAPGGKTLRMAEVMQNTGEIVARDLYPHKLELLEESAARLGLSIIRTEEYDATTPETGGTFDRVLADVPCSGLGLLRKKPDLRYKRTGADIDALVALQREILTALAGAVRPGGRLVYSTCTLCRKENEKNVDWFLQNFPYEREGDDRYIYPQINDADGFYIARLRRKDER